MLKHGKQLSTIWAAVPNFIVALILEAEALSFLNRNTSYDAAGRVRRFLRRRRGCKNSQAPGPAVDETPESHPLPQMGRDAEEANTICLSADRENLSG